MVKVEPPQPGAVHLSSAKLTSRLWAAKEPLPSCIWSRPSWMPVSTEAVRMPWTFVRLRARGCSSSPSPSSRVMPRACRKEVGRSRMASSDPVDTLRSEVHVRMGLVELGKQVLRDGCGEGGDKAGSSVAVRQETRRDRSKTSILLIFGIALSPDLFESMPAVSTDPFSLLTAGEYGSFKKAIHETPSEKILSIQTLSNLSGSRNNCARPSSALTSYLLPPSLLSPPPPSSPPTLHTLLPTPNTRDLSSESLDADEDIEPVAWQ